MPAAIETMAYVGETPWHGLGANLPAGESLESWAQAAGLDWHVEERPVYMFNREDALALVPEKKVLVRSDRDQPLSVVSQRYHVVHPKEVLEFYRSLIEKLGYQLETAGMLFNGRRVWALARTGESFSLDKEDRTDGFILLATSYDGTMATVASRTSVRVVCANTLRLAVGEDGRRGDVVVPHAASFNPDLIKGRMGLENNEAWEAFRLKAKELAKRRVSQEEAIQFFLDMFYPLVLEEEEETGAKVEKRIDPNSRGVQKRMGEMLNVFETAPGQQTKSARGTAWGLVQAVTRYFDHERPARLPDNRLNRAWFEDGMRMKVKSFQEAVERFVSR